MALVSEGWVVVSGVPLGLCVEVGGDTWPGVFLSHLLKNRFKEG